VTDQPDTMTSVTEAIRDFQFCNYGLDYVDPRIEYAEWVPDLASAIVGSLPESSPAPNEQLDAAYRERAHLVAWLAALHPAVIAPAPDVDEPGWQIVYITAGRWQMSWHIAPRDAELFRRVEHVAADDPRAQWDGHTTDQKYARIRSHTRLLHMSRSLDEHDDESEAQADRELANDTPGATS
jgi:hypothetical protein